MKARTVKVTMSLNDAQSLIAYLDLFAKAMRDRKGPVFQLFDTELSSSDWMAEARAKASIEAAVADDSPERIPSMFSRVFQVRC
jgi:hypothetical protein